MLGAKLQKYQPKKLLSVSKGAHFTLHNHFNYSAEFWRLFAAAAL
jgi:hypothetical protein